MPGRDGFLLRGTNPFLLRGRGVRNLSRSALARELKSAPICDESADYREDSKADGDGHEPNAPRRVVQGESHERHKSDAQAERQGPPLEVANVRVAREKGGDKGIARDEEHEDKPEGRADDVSLIQGMKMNVTVMTVKPSTSLRSESISLIKVARAGFPRGGT